MDVVFIEQLIVMGLVGLYDWEQQRLQKLVFDLQLGWDKSSVYSFSNQLNYLDYDGVINTVFSVVQGKQFSLLEHVAEKVTRQLMINFDIVWIRLKIGKPEAVSQACNVGIVIERDKKVKK